MTNDYQITLCDRSFAVLEMGDPNGIPILALHGWLDNAASFRRVAEHLKGVRLIALDLAGHGLSDHREQGHSYYIWDNVTDVIELIDMLDIDQIGIVGHSMGASIATLVAACYPDRVSRLCLIDGIAPLAHHADELPSLMAAAINKARKKKKSLLKPYLNMNDAAQARMKGRWPVDMQAAMWLVERGLCKGEDGYHWRNDMRLVQPSILRMSEQQVRAFISSVKCSVELVLAEQGIGEDLILERIESFKHINVVKLNGNHHLHLQPYGAEQVAMRLNAWL